MPKYYLQHYGFVGDDESYLAHHGIEGMRWGKRNGPPYPLSDAKHDKVVGKSDKESKKANKYDVSKLSRRKRDAIYNDIWKNWKNKDAMLKKYRKYLKYSDKDAKDVEEAKKYGFEPDERGYLLSILLHPGEGELSFEKPVKFDGNEEHRISIDSDYETRKFNFPLLNSNINKYVNNGKSIRNKALKVAREAGIYDDILDNVMKPGEVLWDTYSRIDDGKGDIITFSCWSLGDHSQNFRCYMKNGKIEIGPLDG